jgi:hypothetical protein
LRAWPISSQNRDQQQAVDSRYSSLARTAEIIRDGELYRTGEQLPADILANTKL